MSSHAAKASANRSFSLSSVVRPCALFVTFAAVAVAATVALGGGMDAAGPPTVGESAREIPVAYEVDVVVVGGGTGAVAAAVAAAEAGSSVFLAAPYPYLGDEMTATLRLWLEPGETPTSPLAKAVFDDPLAETDGGPPRPLHVKATLEQALLDAGVEFLFSCHPAEVLHDEEGAPAGIVMANRAGRQAVLARTIVDATDRGTVARLAGARFRTFPAGPQTFKRTVVGGEPVAIEEGSSRLVDPPWQRGRFATIEYTLELDLPDGSFRSFAAADQRARTLTYHPDQQMTADRLFAVPPDAVHARESLDGEDRSAGELPLDAFRPAGVERLYLLGGAADVGRARAERLLRPLEQMELGARIGAAAAAEAAGVGELVGVRLSAQSGGGVLPTSHQPQASALEVRELLDGVRPVQKLPTIPQEERELPVLGRYDVVVVGGGTGGAPAAIAAAREGARVLVVEHQHMLGGVGTVGQIAGYYHGNRVGFTATVPGDPGWAIEQKAEWWRRALLDEGAEIWFGAIGCGAVVEGDRVAGAVVATPHGRGVVLADVVIDSTSNADIAAPAGAETDYTGSGEFGVMGAGTTFRRLGGRGANPSFTLVDDTDLIDLWHVLVWSKQKYPDAFDQAPLVNTRERRRIVGDFRMTVLDQIVGRTYPDTISQANSDFDTHGFTVDPYLMLETPPRAQNYLVNIPYRCLLPRGLEGLLATGLGMSMHRDAVPLVRMQACIQNQGYAAGLAAAAASREGVPLRAIDIRALQKKLVEIGNLPEEVLEHEDSLPMAEEEVARAVREFPPLWTRHAGGDRRVEEIARRFEEAPPREDFWAAAVLFQHPETALPLLREAYASSEGETRFAYAQKLAMLGDATGAELLLERVRSADGWDFGWRYASMSNFGSALSPLDTAIIALARAGYEEAVPTILEKVALLDATVEFSHHRAAALALERLGDPAAAAALAALLAKPGMSGHVHDSLEAARAHDAAAAGDLHAVHTRRDSLRELLVARALFRLGDHDGLGRSILEAYTADLRGHLARHARAVLETATASHPREAFSPVGESQQIGSAGEAVLMDRGAAASASP